MRCSFAWLLELCDLPGAPPSAETVAERLTLAGLEVEGIERIGEGLDGVVVAEVLARAPHPKADALSVVEVTDGTRRYSVVCGAPNVPAPGGHVALAKLGAELSVPQGGGGAGARQRIERREVRGVPSEGMLCSAKELGLGEDASGLLLLEPSDRPGTPIAEALEARDAVLEINVTPNRGDCLSHLGVAREIVAQFGGALRWPALAPDVATGEASPFPVDVQAPELCPRYTALALDGLRTGPSPRRIQRRLASVGVRPISNVVDVTNYVMLELGHPLHAFDLDKLAGPAIVVRAARAGERILTLDGVERALEPGDVVIRDARGPIALAGVMGGRDSEVTASTRRVLLEAAAFDPRAVRRTARRTGLASESSYRFERGVDPAGVRRAARRAERLFADLAGGRAARPMTDVHPRPTGPRTLRLRLPRLRIVLGAELRADEVQAALAAFEIAARPDVGGAEALICEPPSFRSDLTREVDLVEEVARHRGLDRIEPRLPAIPAGPEGNAGVPTLEERLRTALAGLGLDEAQTLGFASRSMLDALGAPELAQAAVAIRNPLGTESALLRPTLLANLLAAARLNQDRGTADVRLFEIGTVFARRVPPAGNPLDAPAGGARNVALSPAAAAADAARPEEQRRLAVVLAGQRDGWLKPGGDVDLFDLKGLLEELAHALRLPLRVVPAGTSSSPGPPAPREAPAYLHPGLLGAVISEERHAGWLGEVHPAARAALGIERPAFALEIELAALAVPAAARFVPPPRYPGVDRDISFFVDEAIPAAELVAALESGEGLLRSVRVTDEYREPGKVPAGKKGILLALTYRANDRTLTDTEVGAAHARLIERLHGRFRVDLR